MAQYPKIRLQFVAVPTQENSLMEISIGSFTIIERTTFLNPPGYRQYTIGPTISQCATNLYQSLVNGNSAPFSLELNATSGWVEITAQSYDIGNFTYSIENNNDFYITTVEVEEPVQFSITGITYSQATDKCNNIKAAITVKDVPQASDFRVPTEAEWEAERLTWATSNINGAFNSVLKLPSAGRRSHSAQGIYDAGFQGYYWSSTTDGTNAKYLIIKAIQALASNSTYRAISYSLRLIMNEPYVGEAVDFVSNTIDINGLTYNTVLNPTTNRVWLDRNLGASQVATSINDTASFGGLFQWGRIADGHENRTSLYTTALSNTDIPGHNKVILNSASPFDWRSPQNNNLWQTEDYGAPEYLLKAIYNGSTQETKITTDEADFFFDFPRYSTGSRRIEIISGADVKFIDVGIVKRVLSIDVLIVYSVGGATITINPNQSAGTVNITPFQFSIDDIVFQASNVFEIAVSGNFTAYVVDKYGCKKSVGFTISLEERKADPYFKIEITNPLRAVDQNYSGIKNITNQLSANIDLANIESRFYRQPFRIGDIARTQIKTNYETLAVKIYDCNDELVDTITPELKIENTNQLDKRSVIIAPGEAGQTHVAMMTGTIYDPITGDAIDTYFQSSGRLPSFVRVGMLMTFSNSYLSGTFEVKEIAYNELLEAWVCVIDANYTFAAIEVVVLNTYNLEEYNIYEVEITLNEGQYYAVFEATDSSEVYPDVNWKSEPFWFSDDSEVVVIDYTSEINEALIDYRTGVEFRLCVPGRFVKYQPDIQGEDFRDDLGNIYLQKSTYNRAWMIETDLLPWWLAEKVMIASRHKNLKIDGIKVVNTEAPEITDRLGDRNPFYQITGTYQENIDISISDETGIISGSRGILSGNENTVIGI